MAVNLSCLQLEDPTLVEYLAQTLREEGVSAEHIIVELTESYLAPNLERLSGLLAQMRGLGLRVAMDDFGTGYSSLSVLKHAPVDIVKIDRSILNAAVTQRGVALLRGIRPLFRTPDGGALPQCRHPCVCGGRRNYGRACRFAAFRRGLSSGVFAGTS